jgi:hypothetical protein
MKQLSRWALTSLAVLATTVALSAAFVPTAVGDPAPTGFFAIGDGSASVGAHVTFWGAKWWKQNDVSSKKTRPSFKGYAGTFDPATCSFTTRTGNSTPPPDPPVDGVITVLVASSVTQDGPVINGTVSGSALVAVDEGYDDNPGHEGTGTVLAVSNCTVTGGGEEF